MRDRISGAGKVDNFKDRKASAAQVAEAGTMSVALKRRGSEALGDCCAVGWLRSPSHSNRLTRRRARQEGASWPAVLGPVAVWRSTFSWTCQPLRPGDLLQGTSGSSAIGASTGRERPSCMKPTASRARNVALADDPSSPSNITTAPAAGRRAGRTRRQSDDSRS
jgi:hypothetical protein